MSETSVKHQLVLQIQSLLTSILPYATVLRNSEDGDE